MTFWAVFTTELVKLRRSRVTWLTLAAFAVAPLAGALFMWIVREPGRAAQLGLLGAKANLSGLTATWPSYLMMVTMAISMGGMLLTAVITTYVFGREYADGTAKNMLALPVGRHWFVLGKLSVAALWWAVLVIAVAAEAITVAAALHLADYSSTILAGGIRDMLLVAIVTFLLAPPVAWIAVWGRGYLPALGFTLFTMVLGVIVGHTGWGKWFPWSIAPLFTGAAGPRSEALAPGSLVVLLLTFVAATAATIAQVRWADNTQ